MFWGPLAERRARILRDELASLRAVAVVELRIKGSDLHGMAVDRGQAHLSARIVIWACLSNALLSNALPPMHSLQCTPLSNALPSNALPNCGQALFPRRTPSRNSRSNRTAPRTIPRRCANRVREAEPRILFDML